MKCLLPSLYLPVAGANQRGSNAARVGSSTFCGFVFTDFDFLRMDFAAASPAVCASVNVSASDMVPLAAPIAVMGSACVSGRKDCNVSSNLILPPL